MVVLQKWLSRVIADIVTRHTGRCHHKASINQLTLTNTTSRVEMVHIRTAIRVNAHQ